MGITCDVCPKEGCNQLCAELNCEDRSGMAVIYNCDANDEPCKKASQLCLTMDCRCFNTEATSCSQCHCRRPCAKNDIDCCQNTMECVCPQLMNTCPISQFSILLHQVAITARDCAMCAPPCG